MSLYKTKSVGVRKEVINGKEDVSDTAAAFKDSEVETGWRMHITATPLH